MHPMSISLFLKSVGLDEHEQSVYLELLKTGDAETSRIAKRCGLKRSTTFHILEALAKKGLASSYREKNIRRFVAENPKKIREGFEGKIAAFEKYLPELEKFYATAGGRPRVRFFEGYEGVRTILEEVLECREKTVYSMGSIEKAKEALGASIRYAKRRAERKIFAKNLRAKDDKLPVGYIENQRKELREVRFLPAQVRIPLMVHMWDDKVAVLASKEEGFGIIVESREFSTAMKSIFEALWNISEKTVT